MKIPLYAENYEEYDGTIASSPSLQKVVVFFLRNTAQQKKVVVRAWIRKYRVFGQKEFKKTPKTQQNGHRLGFASRRRRIIKWKSIKKHQQVITCLFVLICF